MSLDLNFNKSNSWNSPSRLSSSNDLFKQRELESDSFRKISFIREMDARWANDYRNPSNWRGPEIY